MKRLNVVACVVTWSPGEQLPRSRRPRARAPSDRALMTQLVAREDSRAGRSHPTTRVRGVSSTNPFIRAFTVRGLGRLENPRRAAIRSPACSRTRMRRSARPRRDAHGAIGRAPAAGPGDARRARRARLAMVSGSGPASWRRCRSSAIQRSAARLLESIGRLAQGSVDAGEGDGEAPRARACGGGSVERRGADAGSVFLSRKREARAPAPYPLASPTGCSHLLGDRTTAVTRTDRFAIWPTR